MRTLGKIKLNHLSKDELDQRKMKALKGGCSCTYGCGCTNTCSCNDWLSGGINSANLDRAPFNSGGGLTEY